MGVSCTVVNARWIKPVDPRVAEWARSHDVVVTVEDNVGAGGFGGAVLETLATTGLAGRVRTIALPDEFLPHGKAAEILQERGLDAAGVARSVYAAVRGGLPAEEAANEEVG
jgi:1-deoxy-D-xylulose-5-phosphate synthase